MSCVIGAEDGGNGEEPCLGFSAFSIAARKRDPEVGDRGAAGGDRTAAAGVAGAVGGWVTC